MATTTLALRIAGTIFGIVGLLHLIRILTEATVMIEGFTLPVWVNWLGLFGAGFLCVWMWGLTLKH